MGNDVKPPEKMVLKKSHKMSLHLIAQAQQVDENKNIACDINIVRRKIVRSLTFSRECGMKSVG